MLREDQVLLQAAKDISNAAANINAELTILAPNNGAFSDLSTEELAALIANTGELTEVLQRHVIEGAVKAADLSDGQTVTTLGGEELTVSVAGDTITFTAAEGGTVATVVTADLMSCKGVVHIISEVLIPGDEPELGGGDEPAGETPVEETPAGEEPVEETPVEETPAGEEPVEETPAGEEPVEETPVEETPAGEEPVEENPVDTPVDTPGDCGSPFDVIVETGELGNLETVVLVRLRNPAHVSPPKHPHPSGHTWATVYMRAL